MKRRGFIKTAGGSAAGLALTHAFTHDANATTGLQPGAVENKGLPYRQIHLDFHTSRHIEGIGADFDPEEFASTLKKAGVNSVTCFGRCHHGYMYYDSSLYPERVHPHLKNRNLLKEQVEACHKVGIRVPIYVTIQWDYFTARQHPEWCAIDQEGKLLGTEPFEAGFYNFLDVSTPYRDFLKKSITEMFEKVGEVDGLFLDIVKVLDASNRHIVAAMLGKGMDPTQSAERLAYYEEVMADFKSEMTAMAHKLNKDCSVFYNGGHVGPEIRHTLKDYTHLELESLPSGSWGYMHFPLTSRFARTLGKDVMGMTGKFHTAWGDFHSLKNQAALEFECFMMLAMNARCSIGDQLHPSGKIEKATYDLVGSVYNQVAEKEAWCYGAKAVTDIALMSAEEFVGGRVPAPSKGAVRMLQEAGHQFDIVDSTSDLTGYKVLILPDVIAMDSALTGKIEKFIAEGGAVLASYQSGLNPEKDAFALGALGISYKGMAPYSPDFIKPTGAIGKGLQDTEYVMYLQGAEVEANGAEVLEPTVIPYFNRTYKHFCSHRHTPSSGKTSYPAILKKGKVVYFMHPIFRQYNKNAPLWCKKMILNALDMLLPEPAVRTNGPSSMVVALNEQTEQNRRVLHLLHYVPEQRGEDFEIIEDVLPVYNVEVSVRADGNIRSVAQAPDGKRLRFKKEGNRIVFTVPEIRGHQMVVLS